MPLSLTELSNALHLSTSTIQRLTFTLHRLGYLNRNHETKKFKLGPKSLAIGFSGMRNFDLKSIAYPFLEEASKQVNETVNFAILEGDEIVYIERIVAQQVLNVNIQIGSRRPLYCTSMGKAILAFLPEKRIEEILKKTRFVRLTQYTKTRKDDLRVELRGIRTRGFAVNNEELEIGVRSVAAPVRDLSGAVIAAVNIAVPTSRVPLIKLESLLAKKVMDTARRISLAIGYKEGPPSRKKGGNVQG